MRKERKSFHMTYTKTYIKVKVTEFRQDGKELHKMFILCITV